MTEYRIISPLSRLIGRERSSNFLSQTLVGLWAEYRHANIAYVGIDIEMVTPTSRRLARKRLARTHELLGAYQHLGLEPFEAIVAEGSGRTWLTLPPIVERSLAGTFLLDGSHRLFTARRLGIKNVIVALVVGDSFSPLCCRPQRWDDYSIVDATGGLAGNLEDFDPRFFRPFTTTFNSMHFSDIEQLTTSIEVAL